MPRIFDNTDLQGTLGDDGFALIGNINSTTELLALGKSLGQLVPSPGGEMVKEIRITPQGKAIPGSQSSRHGTGAFPLHTDTVFWPDPVRYVILRGSGDTRRPTKVLSFAQLFKECDPSIRVLAAQSVWTVWTGSRTIFCSLRLGDEKWRYDSDLMRPENRAAQEVDAVLRPLVGCGLGQSITWSGTTVLVLANQLVLHGRGPQPLNEGERIIERVYVR
jgi:L-asparagine oxygenase